MPEEQMQEEESKKSDHPISDYYDEERANQMQEHEPGIKKARNALFITAGLYLLWELIAIGRSGGEVPPLGIAIIAVEVGSFVALAFWTKTKPYTAIIVGLILFILLWVLAIALVGGTAIYGGIIFRIIILVNLISALKSAKAWEDIKKNG